MPEELPCWRVVVSFIATRAEVASELVESPSPAKAAMFALDGILDPLPELRDEEFMPGGAELVALVGDYRVSVRRSVLKPQRRAE